MTFVILVNPRGRRIAVLTVSRLLTNATTLRVMLTNVLAALQQLIPARRECRRKMNALEELRM